MTDFISILDRDKRTNIAEDISFYATKINMLSFWDICCLKINNVIVWHGLLLYRGPDSVCQAYMCTPNVLYWIHGYGLCALIYFTLNVASPCSPHPIPSWSLFNHSFLSVVQPRKVIWINDNQHSSTYIRMSKLCKRREGLVSMIY